MVLINNTPAPSFVRLLLAGVEPVIGVVVIETSPTPPNVKPLVLVIPPLIVNVFVPDVISVLILVAVCAVIVPDKVAAGFVLNTLKAPKPSTPKPFKFKGSVSNVTPFNSNVAVLLIVVD